jgi:calcineurin-like phosphoesterase family protein
MRILCVSDQVDPVVYSLRMKERFGDIDLVLSAGDLPMEYLGFISAMLNRPIVYVEGNHDLKASSHRGIAGLTKAAAGRGFSAEWGDFGYLGLDGQGGIDAGWRLVREGGLCILGLPGSMLYNRGPNQFSELSMGLRLAFLVPRLLVNRIFHGRAVDIVLTHSPPRGIHDRADICHRGFGAFLWLMRVFRPRWLVHGHIHLYDLADVRLSRYEGTDVVNAFGHWILDTEALP